MSIGEPHERVSVPHVDRSTRTRRDPETATRTACPRRPSRDWTLCRLESGWRQHGRRIVSPVGSSGARLGSSGGAGIGAGSDGSVHQIDWHDDRSRREELDKQSGVAACSTFDIDQSRFLASGRVSRPATSSMSVRNAVFTTRSGAAADPSARSSLPWRTSAVITWSSKWISKVRLTSVAASGRTRPSRRSAATRAETHPPRWHADRTT